MRHDSLPWSAAHCVAPYEERFADAWDAFLKGTHGGTVMHSRHFLAYHGDRFQDESLCVWRDPGVRLKAVMPLARSLSDADTVVSHPGSTFGGLIEDGIQPAERAVLLSEIARLLRDRGYRTLVYKPAPAIFGEQFDESDLRLLLQAGTVRRSDLWSFIRLDHRHGLSAKRRASVKAAARKGVTVRKAQTEADWPAFHAMLAANLAVRHHTAPVHTLEQMLSLRARMAGENELWLAEGPDGALLAGTWCFAYNAHALHTQYIASTPEGRGLGAVDCLLAGVIDDAVGRGLRILSFGISTQPDGYRINDNLLKQKLRFGAGVAVCWQFDVDLARLVEVAAGFE